MLAIKHVLTVTAELPAHGWLHKLSQQVPTANQVMGHVTKLLPMFSSFNHTTHPSVTTVTTDFFEKFELLSQGN